MNKPARRRSSYKKTFEDDGQEQQDQSKARSSATDTLNPGAANMDGANRKVELQSPEDLTYLITNVRRAAAEHIGAAFPPVEGDDAAAEEDELRVRIEELVNDYINQTFTLAAPNLSINGFDLDASTFPAVYLSDDTHAKNKTTSTRGGKRTRASAAAAATEPIIQYEPFDARKRARVEELAREEEDLMREIAALKRRMPGAAARQWAEGFRDGVRADEEALEAARAQAGDVSAVLLRRGGAGAGEAEGEEDGQEAARGRRKKGGRAGDKNSAVLLEDLGSIERVEDVEKGFVGIVDALGRLKRDMPATVAKMERARVAGEYVVTER